MASKGKCVHDEGNQADNNQLTQLPYPCLNFHKCWYNTVWLQKHTETIFRKVAKEEAEQATQRWLANQGEPSQTRKFMLQFNGKLPSELYTHTKVKKEGNSPIQVELLDPESGHTIKDGSLSSLKLEIVVLQGDFKVEQLEDWTQQEFIANIVPKRKDKAPLLFRDTVIKLQNGIAYIDEIQITDNSSRVKSKMFRLGARPFNENYQVKEAVSNAFRVKDQRGASNKKHKTPSPEDEVWHLNGIHKGGKICNLLAERKIRKVKDLVTLYANNQEVVHDVLGVRAKKIVEQATSCFSTSMNANQSEPMYSNVIPNVTGIMVPQSEQLVTPSQDQPLQTPGDLGFADTSHGCYSAYNQLLSQDDIMMPPLTTTHIHPQHHQYHEFDMGDFWSNVDAHCKAVPSFIVVAKVITAVLGFKRKTTQHVAMRSSKKQKLY